MRTAYNRNRHVIQIEAREIKLIGLTCCVKAFASGDLVGVGVLKRTWSTLPVGAVGVGRRGVGTAVDGNTYMDVWVVRPLPDEGKDEAVTKEAAAEAEEVAATVVEKPLLEDDCAALVASSFPLADELTTRL